MPQVWIGGSPLKVTDEPSRRRKRARERPQRFWRCGQVAAFLSWAQPYDYRRELRVFAALQVNDKRCRKKCCPNKQEPQPVFDEIGIRAKKKPRYNGY